MAVTIDTIPKTRLCCSPHAIAVANVTILHDAGAIGITAGVYY